VAKDDVQKVVKEETPVFHMSTINIIEYLVNDPSMRTFDTLCNLRSSN